MSEADLKRNLEAELLKIERQDKIYSVGETRYDLMIRDVLNYIDNSISKEVIEKKIEQLNEQVEKYREYAELGIETDTEWVDNVADRQTIKVLQELLGDE